MKSIDIKGTVRTETGKKATKQLRKEGIVPCNLYGEARDEKGLASSTPLLCANCNSIP